MLTDDFIDVKIAGLLLTMSENWMQRILFEFMQYILSENPRQQVRTARIELPTFLQLRNQFSQINSKFLLKKVTYLLLITNQTAPLSCQWNCTILLDV